MSSNAILVSERQKGNPLLPLIRAVPWKFADVEPDYVVGRNNCAFYLSLRYHQSYPGYIIERLRRIGSDFELRVLLLLVDMKASDAQDLLKEITIMCINANLTLLLAWNVEEAARYLETFKAFEHKGPELLLGNDPSAATDLLTAFTEFMSAIKSPSVTKGDCVTLLANFGTVAGVMGASAEQIALCPGIGPKKARRIVEAFRTPFLTGTPALSRAQAPPPVRTGTGTGAESTGAGAADGNGRSTDSAATPLAVAAASSSSYTPSSTSAMPVAKSNALEPNKS